jgi:multidrug efflux pump subunit AcrA (membrane-fusion protein)
MRKRAVVGLVVLAGVVGALGWGVVGLQDAGAPIADAALFTARRGPLRIAITEHGVLQAKHSAKVVSLARRSGKITYLVEEGTVVAEGDVLCRLDATPLEQQLQGLRLDVVKTEADLNTARTELAIQKSENAAEIEKAAMTLEKARKEFERYTDGDAPQERVKLQIAIKAAETKLTTAQDDAEQTRRLHDKGFVSSAQLRQAEIAHEQAIDELALARREMEIFETFAFPMTFKEKQVAIADAERAATNASLRAEAKLRQREVAVESEEERLRQLRKQIEVLETEIANFTLTAPVPGVVIYGDPAQSWFREYVKIGGDVWGGMTLFTIPDLRVMQALVQVHETDIDKLAVGQRATVTMDTYPGLFLEGSVTRIANLASGGGADPASDEVRRFTVEIDLDSTEGRELKPGVSAKAEVFVREIPDALHVPTQCVFAEDGAMRVLVDAGDGPERRAVEIGAANDRYVQIVAGLEPGDRVLLYNPSLPGRRDAAPAEAGDDAPATPAGPVAAGR